MKYIHIDVETYSSEDIRKSGHAKYCDSLDFEVLMIGYAIDDHPVKVIDLCNGDEIPLDFKAAIADPEVLIYAHNAAFEYAALNSYLFDIPQYRFRCTAVLAASCGLPRSLDGVTKALGFAPDKAKDAEGLRLIRTFSIPRKPTKNNPSARVMPSDDPVAWGRFLDYCAQDVVAEREVHKALDRFGPGPRETAMYLLDQKINNRGVLLDLELAKNSIDFAETYKDVVLETLRAITDLDNPSSPKQMTEWLTARLGEKVSSLKADLRPGLIEKAKNLGDAQAEKALDLYGKTSLSSISKFKTMLEVEVGGLMLHSMLFYGAERTGRWAGRGVQPQNLPRNYFDVDQIKEARRLVKENRYHQFTNAYDDPMDVLKQLLRSALIARQGKTLVVSDFSAIEARVLAWLAGEQWRLTVFQTHGKIYEASAAAMLNKPIEEITSEERSTGKVAELALGYQGSKGALLSMGAEEMGMSSAEIQKTVLLWRNSNKNIVNFWYRLNDAALQAMTSKKVVNFGPLRLLRKPTHLAIELPSGRRLRYWRPSIKTNDFGRPALHYFNQTYGGFIQESTYGGKLTENVTQAIARDLLAEALLAAEAKGFDLILHVHDEIVAEVEESKGAQALEELIEIMSKTPKWAKGLPLKAAGFTNPFYLKD